MAKLAQLEKSVSIPEALSFRVSPRTMQMLGRDNISSPRVAVVELVKNAFDADAKVVVVDFRQASSSDGMIIISDDGEGMSLSDLADSWMVISTDNKVRMPRTKTGRVKVGEKGIGRLAIDRLCTKATILTFQNDGDGLELEIDWTKYEQDAGELQDIVHPLRSIARSPESRSGTVIALTGLRDCWTPGDYDALHTDLSLLVPPFSNGTSDFSIEFCSDESPELSGRVFSPMAEASELSLESTLDREGIVHQVVRHHGGIVREDTRSWWETFNLSEGTASRTGPLRLVVYFYLRGRSPLGNTSISRAELDRFLDRYQGVRIYRDGFRVKPYGDPGTGRANDWLGLYLRRLRNPVGVRNPGWVVGSNQIVGGIFISRYENPELRDQTNREGLIENDAFRDLERFTLSGIGFLERVRHELAREEEAPELDIGESLYESQAALNAASEQLREVVVVRPTSALEQTQQSDELFELADRLDAVSTQIAETQKAVADDQTERSLLYGLATLGIAMTTFGHETARAVTNVLNRAALLQPVLGELDPAVASRAQKDLGSLIASAERIEGWGRYALERVRRDKRTRRSLSINQILSETMGALYGVLNEYGITTVSDFSEELPSLRALSMDIEAIVVNLVTNSIEALKHTPLQARMIRIRTRPDNAQREVILQVADSGRGIRPGDYETIFSPLYSTRVDRAGDPIGTGMGLAIVKNIVDSYNGQVKVDGRSDLGGAEFEVRLPTDRRNQANGN